MLRWLGSNSGTFVEVVCDLGSMLCCSCSGPLGCCRCYSCGAGGRCFFGLAVCSRLCASLAARSSNARRSRACEQPAPVLRRSSCADCPRFFRASGCDTGPSLSGSVIPGSSDASGSLAAWAPAAAGFVRPGLGSAPRCRRWMRKCAPRRPRRAGPIEAGER